MAARQSVCLLDFDFEIAVLVLHRSNRQSLKNSFKAQELQRTDPPMDAPKTEHNCKQPF